MGHNLYYSKLSKFIFQVKTNKIKAIDARPNTGSIPSKGSSIITVKRNEHIL